MQALPIGVQDFAQIRNDDLLYVDKTSKLLELVTQGRRYFLSRPRRFGKSLTLSTLDAMFSGQSDLFTGLAAEEWVKRQAMHPSPVLRFDMSTIGTHDSEEIKQSLRDILLLEADDYKISTHSETLGGVFMELIRKLYRQQGHVVVLIDEYDKPILDHISDLQKANEVREILRAFYTTLKGCDEYLRFVMLTGISRFSKMGVFSAMNNLEDISMDEDYGSITGYTQHELEYYFKDWISVIADHKNMSRPELLNKLKDYYDGFSFDGKARLYNPFSILQCLKKREFNNYWYESGSPSFIVAWMKEHHIQEPEDYRHRVVRNDFISSQEIEYADTESFLYQSGYLTIEKKEEQLLTLDYPNREVLDSISSMYLKLIYRVEGYVLLGNEIWKTLREGNIPEMVKLYNTALAGIPYDDYLRNRNEYWYRSLFIMLLRGAGIISYSEPHTSKGRADVVIQFQSLVIVLEFKFAHASADVKKLMHEGENQMRDREYAKGYDKVVSAILVADDQERQIVFTSRID